MKESLDSLIDKDKQLKSEFELKEIDISDFAKKLLVKWHFILPSKKGWLELLLERNGVQVLKTFCVKYLSDVKNMARTFDDVLEPLFYEALAQDRGMNPSIQN